MIGFRVPTIVLLAGLFVGTSCGVAIAQNAGGYRWVTGEPTEMKQSVVEELVDLPIPAKIFRHAQMLLKRYDANGSGYLESREWTSVAVVVDPSLADANGDNAITADELARVITNYGRYRKIRMPRQAVQAVLEETDPIESEVEPAVEPAIEPAAADTQQEEPAAEATPVVEAETETAAETMATESEPEPETGAEGEGEDVAEDALIEKPADGAETTEPVATEPAAESAPVRTLKPAAPEPKPIDPRLLPRGTKYYTPRRRLAGMPEWFQTRDTNGDGQISLAEYSSRPTQSTIAKFRHYDRNKDGVITTSEYARVSGGR